MHYNGVAGDDVIPRQRANRHPQMKSAMRRILLVGGDPSVVPEGPQSNQWISRDLSSQTGFPLLTIAPCNDERIVYELDRRGWKRAFDARYEQTVAEVAVVHVNHCAERKAQPILGHEGDRRPESPGRARDGLPGTND